MVADENNALVELAVRVDKIGKRGGGPVKFGIGPRTVCGAECDIVAVATKKLCQ